MMYMLLYHLIFLKKDTTKLNRYLYIFSKIQSQESRRHHKKYCLLQYSRLNMDICRRVELTRHSPAKADGLKVHIICRTRWTNGRNLLSQTLRPRRDNFDTRSLAHGQKHFCKRKQNKTNHFLELISYCTVELDVEEVVDSVVVMIMVQGRCLKKWHKKKKKDIEI